MIKKNDTNYIIILGIQAFGILVNFIQIIFGVLINSFFYCKHINFYDYKSQYPKRFRFANKNATDSATAINSALQPDMSAEELYSLVS